MPAYVTFDSDPQLFATPTYANSLFESSNDMQFLDPNKFASAFFPLQPLQQLLTPPSSPKSMAMACSPFDEVPFEILDHILGLVHDDTSRRVYDVLHDISACCLVSRRFHSVAINWLYRHVPISDPYAFTKVICNSKRLLIQNSS